MSRLCKLSIEVACSVGVIVSVMAPQAALAKNGGGGSSMGGFHSSGPSMSSGFSGVSKNVGNFQINKIGNTLPISKLPVNNVAGNKNLDKNIGKLIDPGKGNGKVDPVGKNGINPKNLIGKDPISKTPNSKGPKFDPAFCKKNFHFCDPCCIDFCHHHFCCDPCWGWAFPWLLPTYCEEVVCIQTVYAEPLYTLFYETKDGIKVYSRYELPSETATLYKTEQLLDASKTAWWLVSTTGQLVDTNTAEKVVSVSTAAVSE